MIFRGFTLKENSINLDTFTRSFIDDGFIKISGNDITVLLIHPEKKYAKLDNNTKTLVKKHLVSKELLIVSNVSYLVDQHVIKIKNIISFMNSSTTLINFRSYSNFLYDIPNHVLTSPHRIVPKDEVKAELSLVYLDIKELPKIYDHDTQATWIGASAGDIIEVERSSPLAGVTIGYREVISKVHS
jgi:DNA-directed RNA polymerase subunit H (RpoH/RPB5)